MKARWFNNYVCKNEEELLERLDQAILNVIDSLEKAQKNDRFRNVILTKALYYRPDELYSEGYRSQL